MDGITQRALAYVFWHWPRAGVNASEYERDLVSFQERLLAAGVPDLRAATTFRLTDAPLAPMATPSVDPVYEDWYVVTGFAALEHLNTAAVSPALRPTHDRAATQAAGGAAGLYALRHAGQDGPSGAAGLPRGAASAAHWFGKPDGTSYVELDELLVELLASEAPDASVWQRQMVLGPTAEFCLITPAEVSLPADLRPRTIPRERLA